MWPDAALILGAYLIGSFPHLAVLSRLRGIKVGGDLHINLWHRGGRLVGLIGIFGEFVKGVTPVLVGRYLDFSLLVIVLAGLAVVSGQMWPIFLRFDGEKGNSIGVAMAAVLAPAPFFVALVPILVGVTIKLSHRLTDIRKSLNERLRFGGPPSRSLPLGMAGGFLVLPFASCCLGEPPVVTLGFCVLFLLIKIRRLTAGLGGDLTEGADVKRILINRLLYDRSYM